MPKVRYHEMLPHEIVTAREAASVEYGEAGVRAVVEAIVERSQELPQQLQ